MADRDTVDALRHEMRSELADVRIELRELRRLLESASTRAGRRPSREELQEGQDEMDRLRETILRDRGGELLPSMADEIARSREERAAQILGEAAG